MMNPEIAPETDEIQTPETVTLPDIVAEREGAIEPLETNAQTTLQRIRQFTIEDAADMEVLVDEVKVIRDRLDAVDEFFEPMRAPAYEVYNAVLERRRQVKQPLETAVDVAQRKISMYRQEQKRIAREKAAEERRRQEEEARRRRAEAKKEAEARGDTEKAEAIEKNMDAPAAGEPEKTAKEVEKRAPKTKGMQERTVWHADLDGETDEERRDALRALAEAVAKGEAPSRYLEANLDALKKVAEATDGEAVIPGVRLWSTTKTIVSRR